MKDKYTVFAQDLSFFPFKCDIANCYVCTWGSDQLVGKVCTLLLLETLIQRRCTTRTPPQAYAHTFPTEDWRYKFLRLMKFKSK